MMKTINNLNHVIYHITSPFNNVLMTMPNDAIYSVPGVQAYQKNNC